MIPFLTVRRGWATLLAATALLLSACGGGGGGGSGTATLRLLNATNDVASLDLYLTNTKTFSARPADALSEYVSVGAENFTVKVTSAGNPSALLSGSFSLSKNTAYTGVVWGRTGSLKFVTLPESDDVGDILDGSSRVRVYNATSDSGSLDVYLTQNVDDLANATPTSANVASTALGGFRELSTGPYRLRVTGAGDINDLRLDVPEITLGEKQYATLIITAGTGGVLVNSALLVQQGALTTQKNNKARVRVVAGADAAGRVTVQVAGTTIAGSLRSPKIGPYTLVDAGDRTVAVLLNGTDASSAPRSFAAGGDYTLLAYGTAGADEVRLFTDDNRLPTLGRYRVRLINGAAGVDPVTLSVDFASLISDIATGVASPFATANANGAAQLDVTSTSAADALYTRSDAPLLSLGVYNMFVLGGNAEPTGILIKDR